MSVENDEKDLKIESNNFYCHLILKKNQRTAIGNL
jgi:hypothetical protein